MVGVAAAAVLGAHPTVDRVPDPRVRDLKVIQVAGLSRPERFEFDSRFNIVKPLYTLGRPVIRKVLKTRIWGSSPGLLGQ